MQSVRKSAFTLIELLVVVAIIALLISILLPSLSKARAQARSTLCASRISQMAKAFLIYANDFDDTPPFVCYGRGKSTSSPPDPNYADKPVTPTGWITRPENWLADYRELDVMWNGEEATWPANWAQSGTIFSYTRFEKLYRCPEFERTADTVHSEAVQLQPQFDGAQGQGGHHEDQH